MTSPERTPADESAARREPRESAALGRPAALAAAPARRFVGTGLALLTVPIALALLRGDELPGPDAYPFEYVLFAVLGVARAAWFWRRGRRLQPLIDLPLLGLVFVFTGGTESPLDPALFLVYALLAFYLERKPRRRLGARYYANFLGGFLGMYGVLIGDVALSQRDYAATERARLDELGSRLAPSFDGVGIVREQVMKRFRAARARIDHSFASDAAVKSVRYFRPWNEQLDPMTAEPVLDFDFETLQVAPLERRADALRSAVPRLTAALSPAEATEIVDGLGAVFDATAEALDTSSRRLSDALSQVALNRGELGSDPMVIYWSDVLSSAEPYSELETIADRQTSARADVEDFCARVLALADRKEQDRRALLALLSERVSMAILVLATLSLMAGLRHTFEEEVARREAARAEVEVAQQEREKDNWIALTAGLTHTIGNDILAYDAYAEEALDALDASEAPVPDTVRRNLKFIHDSNKARLAFIKFLDEFARARKVALGNDVAAPRGLAAIAIEPLIRGVRAQVGEVETADLPKASADPQVVLQRRKFLELPLEVAVEGDGEEAGRFTAGKKGILQFFCYELLKNALRNCSGRRPIRVEVQKAAGRVRLRFINDLEIAEVVQGEGALRRVLYRLPRIAGIAACPEAEFRTAVQEVLDHCFEPSRGGGTGLGLFLIRYFAREYYRGSVKAMLLDWDQRLVAFELDLPDDLGASP